MNFLLLAKPLLEFLAGAVIGRYQRDQQSRGTLAVERDIQREISMLSQLVTNQSHMWEKFGLTETEWWGLAEPDRQKLLSQTWQLVPSAVGGTPTIALSETADPLSMNEYLTQKGAQ